MLQKIKDEFPSLDCHELWVAFLGRKPVLFNALIRQSSMFIFKLSVMFSISLLIESTPTKYFLKFVWEIPTTNEQCRVDKIELLVEG